MKARSYERIYADSIPMPKTIMCGVMDDGGGYKQMQKALRTLGISYAVNEEKLDWMDARISIEFKDCPSTIQQMEEAGFESGFGKYYITQVSSMGIALWWGHTCAGDGQIFVPMSNIIAIHDITDEQLEEMREYAEFDKSK